MESTTKSSIKIDVILKIINKYFPKETLEDVEELVDGCFNTIYKLSFYSQKEIVIKFSPKKNIEVLSYEKDLMLNEFHIMLLAEKAGIPVPKVFAFDDSLNLCNCDYIIMQYMHGQTLNAMIDTVSKSELKLILKTLENIRDTINNLDNGFFGYLHNKNFQSESWQVVFRKLLLAVCDDAMRKNVTLPFSKDELLFIFNKSSGCFDDGIVPRLVHGDLRGSNIIIENGNIIGILDWERAFFGDPLMDLIPLLHDDKKIYNQVRSSLKLTRNEQQRLIWYEIYTLLLLYLEYWYRGYCVSSEIDTIIQWVTSEIEMRLAKLY